METYIAKFLLRDQRISYQPNVTITDMKGENDLEEIYYFSESDV